MAATRLSANARLSLLSALAFLSTSGINFKSTPVDGKDIFDDLPDPVVDYQAPPKKAQWKRERSSFPNRTKR